MNLSSRTEAITGSHSIRTLIKKQEEKVKAKGKPANKKHAEDLVMQTLEKELKRAYQNGLAAGAKAICHVVREQALDTDKSESARLENIVKFCETSLNGAAETPKA